VGNKSNLTVNLFVGFIFIAILYVVWSFVTASIGVNLFGCLNVVPAGYVGVHDVFGNVDPNIQYSGLHLKNPIAGVTTYSVKRVPVDFLASANDDLSSLTSDGATVQMDATVWYHIDGSKAISIYKTLGPEPQNTQLVGELRGIVRSEVSNYTAEDLYAGSERTSLQNNVINALNEKLNTLGIYVDDFQIRDTVLPATVTAAINQKLASQNQITTEQNQLAIEKIKAQEMVVEANGIADSNKIIDGSLSPQYLQWYAIKTLGSNSNVTVIGSNSFGLAKII
jgi:regulator of protease activity HflC (stomatin/prohibitin superfamily)